MSSPEVNSQNNKLAQAVINRLTTIYDEKVRSLKPTVVGEDPAQVVYTTEENAPNVDPNRDGGVSSTV